MSFRYLFSDLLPRVWNLRLVPVVVIVVAGLSLLGAVLGHFSPHGLIPDLAPMAKATAVCFLLGGLALWLFLDNARSRWQNRMTTVLSTFIVFISLLVLSDRWLGVIGEQTAILPRTWMPWASAFCFLFLGLALVLLDRSIGSVWPAEFLATVAVILPLLALIGWSYGALSLSQPVIRRTAFQSLLLFLLLPVGILLARTERGMMAIVAGPTVSGRILRGLLPAAIIIPAVLGWIILEGLRAELYPPTLAMALNAILNTVALVLVIAWNVATLHRIDIERSRAELALTENEAQFRTLANAIPQLAWMAQPDGSVFWYNRRWFEYTGTTLTEMKGWGWQSVHDPEILPQVLERWQLSLDRSEPFEMEYPLRGADGGYRWFLTRIVPLRDENGKLLRWFGTNTDVSQMRASEQAIVRYNERLRVLHEIDKALILGKDPETIAAAALPLVRDLLGVGRVVLNLFDLATGKVQWLAAVGRKRAHVGPGVHYSIDFMGNVEELSQGVIQFIKVEDLPSGPEVDALRASGLRAYAVVPMLVADELIGALSFGGSSNPFTFENLGIAREVATQFAIALRQARLHEQIKQQAEELEERVRERTQQLELSHAELEAANAELQELAAELKVVNQELEAFSYTVSHDLRAPLRGIDGFSRILLEDFGPQLPNEALEHLHEVRDSAREMGQLVDDLLAFSRLGRQALRAQTIDLKELVHDCLKDLRTEQNGRQVEFHVDDLPTCQGDVGLLRQVWLNLLSNALKYTRKKEQARIEIGSSKSAEDQGLVTYFVRDNGAGFDMRYAHNLFGVFQRLHSADDYEGTGVGLATVQRIIQRHGGTVWAEAEPDVGATFYFTLQEVGLEQ